MNMPYTMKISIAASHIFRCMELISLTSAFTRRRRNLAGQTTARLTTRVTAACPGLSILAVFPLPGKPNALLQIRMPTRFALARCTTSGLMPIDHRNLTAPGWGSSKQVMRLRFQFRRRPQVTRQQQHLLPRPRRLQPRRQRRLQHRPLHRGPAHHRGPALCRGLVQPRYRARSRTPAHEQK